MPGRSATGDEAWSGEVKCGRFLFPVCSRDRKMVLERASDLGYMVGDTGFHLLRAGSSVVSLATLALA